jgi:hypothetical protein
MNVIESKEHEASLIAQLAAQLAHCALAALLAKLADERAA